MVDVLYFLDEKLFFCCLDKDIFYVFICVGEVFEGFIIVGMYCYEIDSVGDCGLDWFLVLEVKDIVEFFSLEVEFLDCD